MYFALVSSNSADNTQTQLEPDKSRNGSADNEQRNSNPKPLHGIAKRLSAELNFKLGNVSEDPATVTEQIEHSDAKESKEGNDPDRRPGSEQDGRKHHGNSESAKEGRKSSSSPSLPGGGVDMTLSELQEMAARQQQQIESQQQILVAKEQRLKYLKQQDQKQQQLASENDRLRKLRDKVEAQEMKLKKLRALRGQVEQQKASNGNLNYELESIKALFNEKEKELAMAVAKVEEMTRQLEEIRSGRVKANTNTQSPAALAELEKLKKELMIRNKLNEQQNNKMAANRELLAKRKDELARMDNRIHELQMRLKKKRAMTTDTTEMNKNQVNKSSQNNNINRPLPNIAAVEPFIQEPQSNTSGFWKKDPKYQSLPPSSKFLYPEKGIRQREANNNNVNYNSKQYDLDKSEEYNIPLVVSVDANNKPMQNGFPSPKQCPVDEPPVNQGFPPYSTSSSLQIPHSLPSNMVQSNARFGIANPARVGVSHFTPKPYGSTYSSSVLPNRGVGGVPNEPNSYELPDEIRQSGSGQSSPGSVESNSGGSAKPLPPYPQRDAPPPPPASKPQLQRDGSSVTKEQIKDNQQTTKGQQKENSSKNKGPPPVPNRSGNRQDSVQAISSQTPNTSRKQNTSSNSPDNLSDSEQTNISVSKGIQKFTGLIAQSQQDGPKSQGVNVNPGGFSNLNHASAFGAVKSVPTYRYASKSVIANTYLGRLDSEALEKYQKNVLSLHRDLSANSKTEDGSASEKTVVSNVNDKLKDEEKDSLSPLSSVSSPTGSTPSPSSPLRPPDYPFDFPTTPPHADVASDKVSYKPNTPKNIRRRHSDSDNEEVGKALHKYGINTNSNKNPPSQENQLKMLESKQAPVEIQATTFSDHIPETVLLDNKGNIVEVVDNAKEANNKLEDTVDTLKTSAVTIEVKSSEPKVKKKTNLKSSTSKKNGNRVSFDPLALLLDASLEGELELVRKCAVQVDNVSASNDEGITALHNAICAGHYDIVTFLVEFGCDVNSPDSDGWTPLHCAASCNNLPMVKFLVEHGACIFATTISDQETAAEKCEEEEDGYDGCSEYLYSIQEKLGIMNSGAVYAVFDYTKENTDELDLNIGDKFTVIKKGDEQEKDWWWAKKGEKQGYIPRNLLGLTPRVIPKVQPNGDV